MQLGKMVHYMRRIVELGPRKSFSVLKNRINTKRFYKTWKHKAENEIANHKWEAIATKHNVALSFPFFLKKIKKNYFSFFPEKIVEPFENDKTICDLADRYVEKIFDLLGSGQIKFENILWHEDFRLRKQNPDADYIFDKNCFYQDVIIKPGKGFSIVKDIKIPWELSRCYHFSVLGKAFEKRGNKKYVDAFVEQTIDWIQENRFMLGANWVCPMEVGIRAINWIVAFHFFKNSKHIGDDFWEKFVCSLYDHFFYLERNWEIYDSKTSNHYLSDLVGYLYLCFFFLDLPGIDKKKEWCIQEILREWDKQIFDEGADYEGSTSYHVLVTELFYLFFELCKKNNIYLPDRFEKKLSKMFSFIDWCSPDGLNVVTVGDNDSGKILHNGITSKVIKSYKEEKKKTKKDFFEFGLSIIKTKNVHITFRHHAYKKEQPSGHFHNDAASITLAVDGISIFVDPGSYLYTPSSSWRNLFRSTCSHNSFFLLNQELVDVDERLFFLDIPENIFTKKQSEQKIKTAHRLYKNKKIEAHRELFFNKEKKEIVLTDWWQSIDCVDKNNGAIKTGWNFNVAPGIEIVQKKNSLIFFTQEKKVATIYSEDLIFSISKSYCSFAYGKKVETKSVCSESNIFFNQKIKITIAL